VIFPHIYDEFLEFIPYSGLVLGEIPISFNHEKAYHIENTHNADFRVQFEIHNNILLWTHGAYTTEVVTCDLLTGEQYMCEYIIPSRRINIWDNDMIGFLIEVEREVNEPEKLRPVFLNTHLEELPLELDFDYGVVFNAPLDQIFEGGTLTSEQYIMLGITYNAAKDEYIALYTINPFWENTIGIPNTMQCEMGIAVFDNSGKKLEQYQLPQVIYPVDYSTRSGLEVYIPQLFVRENSLLVVYQVLGYSAFGMEQEYFEQSVKGTAFLVNLATHGAKRLPKEELLEFVTTKLHMEANLNASHNWEATKPVSDPPFKIVEQDNVQLVYLPNEEQPLFAVHPSFRIRDWTQTEDGMYHAIFSK
jgi:hypothetical protein